MVWCGMPSRARGGGGRSLVGKEKENIWVRGYFSTGVSEWVGIDSAVWGYGRWRNRVDGCWGFSIGEIS